jgi:hypothetical protein
VQAVPILIYLPEVTKTFKSYFKSQVIYKKTVIAFIKRIDLVFKTKTKKPLGSNFKEFLEKI